ncbi:MAG TPA: hypothetical protein ENH99_02220 [Candidatus Pacearchaeota archaeon]|nr:hypothetical protein [Candidatus Pacearchaeota archaeon]
MKEITYTEHLDTKDPWYVQKKSAIDSLNQLSDRIRENHHHMYSQLYFTASLLLAILIAFFAESLNLAIIIFLADLMLTLLVMYAKGYYEKRKGYAENKTVIKKSFEELGLELK